MKLHIEYSQENASTIDWLSDLDINNFKPYISTIICDGGLDFEELYGDDFKVISLKNFSPIKSDGSNTFTLFYECTFEFDENKFPNFKSALDNSTNQIEIKVGFKDEAGEIIDDDDLFERNSDVPTEAEII